METYVTSLSFGHPTGNETRGYYRCYYAFNTTYIIRVITRRPQIRHSYFTRSERFFLLFFSSGSVPLTHIIRIQCNSNIISLLSLLYYNDNNIIISVEMRRMLLPDTRVVITCVRTPPVSPELGVSYALYNSVVYYSM